MQADPQSRVGSITKCLREWQAGDESALARLADEVYVELRKLAGAVMARQQGSPTVQPTSLIHDLYLQLPGVQDVDWKSRAHFLNVAAKMMRNILVDHARKRIALKRGGGLIAVDLDGVGLPSGMNIDVLTVHDALQRFEEQYPRQAHIVDLRFFGGLTVEETADVLKATGQESSQRTIERDWSFARAWLQNAVQSN